MALGTLDWFIVGIFFLIVLSIGWVASKTAGESSSEFFPPHPGAGARRSPGAPGAGGPREKGRPRRRTARASSADRAPTRERSATFARPRPNVHPVLSLLKNRR